MQAPALRMAAGTGPTPRRHLFILGFSLVIGGLAVWLLRQPAAKNALPPWLLLLGAMFAGAYALRQLELWLPGEPILPRLAAYPPRVRRASGAALVLSALALSCYVVWRLLPNFRQWQGTPELWLGAIVLMAAGARLTGAVGRGSPRAATGRRLWADTRRNRWLEVGVFALILALAIFMRTFRLDSFPPGIYVDETNGALDALYILEGRAVSPFATGWYGTVNGYFYYMALLFRVFGANWWSLKAASLIPAILTVPAVYLLGRLMFGPLAGLAAMLLVAVSRWHLSMSRWGWNETAPPLFQVLAFYFLIRGLRDRRALDYALSGLLTGLAMYTYLSARLAAATLLLYLVFWFLSDPSGWRAAVRRSGAGMILLATGALVALAPLTVTYVMDPPSFSNRVSEISVLRDINEQQSLEPLAANFVDILRFFHQTGDHQGKHNLPDEPMADPITGLLFAVGVAYALLRWRDQRSMLLLLWLVLGLAGSYLSSHHESPQSYRTLTALPAVALLAADVLDRIVCALYRALREQPSLAAYPRGAAFAAGGLAVVLLSGSLLWESTVYFGPQASSIAQLRGFNPTENYIARETIAALEQGQIVYLSPSAADYSPLRFLVYGVFKAQTGQNTLDARPYRTIYPEANLPLPDLGQDVLLLLDSSYSPLQEYILGLYPHARFEQVKLPDESPLYLRVIVPRADLAALQGLTERVTLADGRTEEHRVARVEFKPEDEQVRAASWEGAIRVEHGGTYELGGEGLGTSLDGQPWRGPHYLGRGLYALRVVWEGGAVDPAGLTWRTPKSDPVPVPADALFRIPGPPQGLLGSYYANTKWEGAPVFRQLTPFLQLAWRDEQPIVPDGPFSARFSGALRVTARDRYSFRAVADDGVRVRLDGILLGEALTPGKPNEFDAELDLTPGDHPIIVDYFQQGGGSALRLLWHRGNEPWQLVPPSALVPGLP